MQKTYNLNLKIDADTATLKLVNKEFDKLSDVTNQFGSRLPNSLKKMETELRATNKDLISLNGSLDNANIRIKSLYTARSQSQKGIFRTDVLSSQELVTQISILSDKYKELKAARKSLSGQSKIDNTAELNRIKSEISRVYSDEATKQSVGIDSIKHKVKQLEEVERERFNRFKNQARAEKGEIKNKLSMYDRLKAKLRSLNSVSAKTSISLNGLSNKPIFSGNDLVRHIRRLESLAVMVYTVKRAFDATVGAGLEFNREMENMGVTITSIIASTSSNKLADNKGTIDVAQKWRLATDEANAYKKAIFKLNVETPTNLTDTTKIFSILLPQMRKHKGTMEEQLRLTKLVSIATRTGNVSMVEAKQALDGLLNGTTKQSSEMMVYLGTLGITNEKIKEMGKSGKVMEYLLETLGKLEPAGKMLANTFDGVKQKLDNTFKLFLGDATKPFFNDIKDGMRSLTETIKLNSDDWVVSFRVFLDSAVNGFLTVKDIATEAFNTMGYIGSEVWSKFNNGLEFGIDLIRVFFPDFLKGTTSVKDMMHNLSNSIQSNIGLVSTLGSAWLFMKIGGWLFRGLGALAFGLATATKATRLLGVTTIALSGVMKLFKAGGWLIRGIGLVGLSIFGLTKPLKAVSIMSVFAGNSIFKSLSFGTKKGVATATGYLSQFMSKLKTVALSISKVVGLSGAIVGLGSLAIGKNMSKADDNQFRVYGKSIEELKKGITDLNNLKTKKDSFLDTWFGQDSKMTSSSIDTKIKHFNKRINELEASGKKAKTVQKEISTLDWTLGKINDLGNSGLGALGFDLKMPDISQYKTAFDKIKDGISGIGDSTDDVNKSFDEYMDNTDNRSKKWLSTQTKFLKEKEDALARMKATGLQYEDKPTKPEDKKKSGGSKSKTAKTAERARKKAERDEARLAKIRDRYLNRFNNRYYKQTTSRYEDDKRKIQELYKKDLSNNIDLFRAKKSMNIALAKIEDSRLLAMADYYKAIGLDSKANSIANKSAYDKDIKTNTDKGLSPSRAKTIADKKLKEKQYKQEIALWDTMITTIGGRTVNKWYSEISKIGNQFSSVVGTIAQMIGTSSTDIMGTISSLISNPMGNLTKMFSKGAGAIDGFIDKIGLGGLNGALANAGSSTTLGAIGLAGGAGALGGNLLDSLFGADTHAGTGGGIGAGVGALVGSFIGPIGTALGAGIGGAIGSLAGGLFGKKKNKQAGVFVDSAIEQFTDIENNLKKYQEWEKKSWFSKKTGTKYSKADDSIAIYVQSLFTQTDDILREFGGNSNWAVSKGKHADIGRSFANTLLLNITDATVYSDLTAVWTGYAKATKQGVDEAIIKAYSSLGNAKIDFERFKIGLNGTTLEQSQFDLALVGKSIKNLGLEGVTSANYLDKVALATKNNLSPAEMEKWVKIEPLLKSQLSLEKKIADERKKQQKADLERIKETAKAQLEAQQKALAAQIKQIEGVRDLVFNTQGNERYKTNYSKSLYQDGIQNGDYDQSLKYAKVYQSQLGKSFGSESQAQINSINNSMQLRYGDRTKVQETNDVKTQKQIEELVKEVRELKEANNEMLAEQKLASANS